MNDKIIIGSNVNNPQFEFEDKDIRSLSAYTSVDVIGTNLTIDQLLPTVEYPGNGIIENVLATLDKSMIVSSDGYVMCAMPTEKDLRLISYGTIIRYLRDGVLKHKMYIDSVERIAINTFKINAMSAIGVLDRQTTYGNIYRGALFSDVLSEIIGDSIPYTVDESIKNIKIYGWIPLCSKRKALHLLLFATGVTLSKDENGNILFRFIGIDEQTNIPNGRIYWNGDVNYPALVSAVDVTEHSFFALDSDDRITLYDNTDGSEQANNTLVAFRDGPIHNLQATENLIIHSSGVNYAIISGVGKLTGQKYTHSTRVLHTEADNAGEQRESVATVTDNYLVSALNSINVSNRILSFYSSRKTVSASIVLENEKAGDLISGTDPYKDTMVGFISSMETIVSDIMKAKCQIVSGYVPTGQGNNYSHFVILTGSGNWNIPQSVLDKVGSTIQVTICSGGHGGFSGTDGEACTTDSFQSQLKGPGSGGKGGEPGPGGRVLTVTIEVGDMVSIPYSCGAGGESDTDGEDTTFGEYSSASGIPTANGIINIISGDPLATPGTIHGVDGGRGSSPLTDPGSGPSVFFNGQQWTPGAKGENVYGEDVSPQVPKAIAEGGSGGGAAVGANGNPGTPGMIWWSGASYSIVSGGYGGTGASAIPGADASVLGGGGQGGHGGGGGGEAGRYFVGEANRGWFGDGGSGGKGSKGGKGGDGFVLIYY